MARNKFRFVFVVALAILAGVCSKSSPTIPTPIPGPNPGPNPKPEPLDIDSLEVVQVQRSPNILLGLLTSPAELNWGDPVTILIKYTVTKEHFAMHDPGKNRWVSVVSCLSPDGEPIDVINNLCPGGGAKGTGIQERSGIATNTNVRQEQAILVRYFINYLLFDEAPVTPETRKLLYVATPYPFEINYR